MQQVVLKAEHIAKSILTPVESIEILTDISLEIKQATSYAILGVSGSGKSTLLNLLAAFDQPTHGTIWWESYSLSQLTAKGILDYRKHFIGFIFQSFHLIPTLTALENVMLPLEFDQVHNSEERAHHALEQVGLAHRTRHFPHELSGGEQQRVAIARALVIRPKVLLADEVTSNLDRKTGVEVADLLFERQREEHMSLVLVTHDDRLAERCDVVFELIDGRIQSA